MIKKILKIGFFVLSISLSLFVFSCAKEKNENIVKKKVYEPNLDKRLEKEKNKVQLFGNNSKNLDVFGRQNVMWRASLEILKSLPLASVSYDAGIIITDWYSPNNNEESIKIVVNIISNEININSIKINSYKKICKRNESCSTITSNENFNNQIKSKIIQKTRELNIAEQKKN